MRFRLALMSICLVFGFLPAGLVKAQNNPLPVVNQPLVPTSMAPGSSGFTLSVNGAGFVPGSVVNWNGIPELSTTYLSSHQLTAEVPGYLLRSEGTVSITVSSPAPGGGTSNAVPFTITTPTKSIGFSTTTFATGLNPAGILAGDFNNDGKPDLAVINQNQPAPVCYQYDGIGTISIYLGNGNGTFLNKSTLCGLNGLGAYPGQQIIQGDFNRDGNTDLVFTYADQAPYIVFPMLFLGDGHGSFSGTSLYSNEGIELVVAADYNGDGNLDLAFHTYEDQGPYPNFLSVLAGNGNGTFGGVSMVQVGTPIVSGDFNGDGIPDLALFNSGSLVILLGNGDGTFTPATSQPSVVFTGPISVVTGDFNGDSILDLVIADPGSTSLTVLKGNGDGTFAQVGNEPPLSDSPGFVTTADLNGDGKLDLIFTSASNTISILFGNGDGTFTPALREAMNFAPNGVAIGDFNGDGKLDLAVANSGDNTISIMLQTAGATGTTVTMASAQNPSILTQPVTYTAVVWANSGTPTGSIAFKQGATVLGTVPLVNGEASFTTTFSKAGTFAIVASYSGDQNNRPKNSKAVKQVVSRYPSKTSVYSSPNPSTQGQTVTLQASVFSEAPGGPTGTVTFKNGIASIGTAKLSGTTATLTTKKLPIGTLTITADYNGDAQSAKSSGTTTQVVNQARSD